MKRLRFITILFLCFSSIVHVEAVIDGGIPPTEAEVFFQDNIENAVEECEGRSLFETLSFVGLMVCACDIVFRAIWNLNKQRKGVYELTPARVKSLLGVLENQDKLTTSLVEISRTIRSLEGQVRAIKESESMTTRAAVLDAKRKLIQRLSALEMQHAILAQELVRLQNPD
ncbi:hypothetical protein JW872_03225 [Candidatus Babeliales bacterium]|nr:hypothetical protein [Candidatus Babeliales bacterium]